jgi:hypothetical protein
LKGILLLFVCLCEFRFISFAFIAEKFTPIYPFRKILNDLFGPLPFDVEPSVALDFYTKKYPTLASVLDSFDPYVFALLNPILPFNVKRLPLTPKPSMEYIADATIKAVTTLLTSVGSEKKV